jgi:hypothetical protein
MTQEQADDKKDAAWRLADAFLESVYDKTLFEDRFDRGMAVMVLVARFVCQEQISPTSYLKWLKNKVEESVVDCTPEEAAAIDERRTETCH